MRLMRLISTWRSGRVVNVPVRWFMGTALNGDLRRGDVRRDRREWIEVDVTVSGALGRKRMARAAMAAVAACAFVAALPPAVAAVSDLVSASDTRR